jgi:hypothetical protein
VPRELEAKYQQSQAALTAAEAKIKELEAIIAQLRSSSGGDAALKAELSMVTKERDEIRDRLKEFEIIADDLANLKRLQQENEQLKRSLAAQGSSLPKVAAPQETAPGPADVSDLLEDLGQSAPAEFLSSPAPDVDEDSLIAEAAIAEDIMADSAPEEDLLAADNKPKSDKTPEDLLSEFEKMLG